MKKLRIGYFADGAWAHQALEKIINNPDFSIAFICVRFDSVDSYLVQRAAELKLPLLKHKNINDPKVVSEVASFNCDILVSMSFNQIFKSALINLAPKKIINCHAGLLPFYRGRNILNWALINNEKEFGISVHEVDAGIDTGDIILQDRFPISEEDTYATLLQRSFVACADILYRALVLIASGNDQRIKQSSIHSEGSYCRQRKAGDEIIDWQQSSLNLFNFIRAVCRPGPMATTHIRQSEVKINSSRMQSSTESFEGVPGQLLKKTERGFLVKTLDSTLEIFDITSATELHTGDRFI